MASGSAKDYELYRPHPFPDVHLVVDGVARSNEFHQDARYWFHLSRVPR